MEEQTEGAIPQDKEGQAIWDELEAEEDSPQKPAQEPKDQEPEQGEPEEPAEEVKKEPERPDYVAALERQVAELTNLVKSTVGRVGSIQSELAKIGQAPTKSEIAQAKSDPEKWAQLKSEFPEWGEAVEEFVASKLRPSDDVLKSAQELVDGRVSAIVMKTAQEIATLAEPDWQEVVESDEFDQWLRKQPADYVSAAAEASANWDAVRVVSIVRDFKKTKTSPRATAGSSQSRLAAATVPSGSTPSRRRLDDLDGKAYWDELDRQERLSAR